MKNEITKFENQNEAVAEFIKVLHGVSMIFRFGSDRVRNAESFIQVNANHFVSFQTPELHPDTIAMYSRMAKNVLEKGNVYGS